MTPFDPAAATAAYLAQIPQAQLSKAIAYTDGGHWLLLWGWLVSLSAYALILKSRVLTRAAGRIQARKPRPRLACLAICLIFLALDFLLELPWQTYASWWRERQYGMTSQAWSGWMSDNLIVTVAQLPVFAVFFLALYAVIRRARRVWPVLAGALVSVLIIGGVWAQPILFEPLVNAYTPAPAGPVRDMVTALGKRTGVPTDKVFIYNGSKQSNRYTANVAGLFGTARIALSDTMFAKGADVAEIRGVVGHEMGHYVRNHLPLFGLFLGVMTMFAGLVVQGLYPIVRAWLGAADVGDVADPAGLPILMMIFATLTLLGAPVINAAIRLEESDADTYSLEHAREPDGLARAFVQSVEYRAAAPSALEEALFYDHPSVARRIRKAMDWKAAHLAEAAGASPPAAPAG